MNDEERRALLVPGTRVYKKPIDVVVEKAERRTVRREDGNHDENVVLHYDHPYVWHDGGHTHSIPWAALADRALNYGIDPESDTFLEDVLEHIIYERHHPDAIDNVRGVLPNGVTRATRKAFGVDRKTLASSAKPHVDMAYVKQHIDELRDAKNVAYVNLPRHNRERQLPPTMDYDRIV
jgi:hypothetical protein